MKDNTLLLPIFILLGIAIFSSVGCKPQISAPLPNELLGEWKTDAHKFTGFSFVITEDFLYFKDKNAEKEIERNTILKIERAVLEDKSQYILYCRNEEGVDITFSFYFKNGKQGTIRLKNQYRFLWKKTG